MRKTIVRVIGVVFLILVGWHLFSLIWTRSQPEIIFSLYIGNFDILGFLYVLLLLTAGYNLLKFNALGRIWAMIALSPFVILFSVASILMAIYLFGGFGAVSKFPGIRFSGTAYGLGKDYAITNPWIAFAIELALAMILWFSTVFLALRKTKELFVDRRKLEEAR